MRRLRKRLTYANVMSSIAVFVVLGGGAYAATTLPKNSVGSKQIKASAVSSSKVKDGALLLKDFKPGQLVAGALGPAGPTGSTGPKGDIGAKGDAGVKGDTGAQGSPGLSGVQVKVVSQTVATGGTGAGTVACPVGKVVLGGGTTVAGGTAGTSYIQRSDPAEITFDADGNPTSYGYAVDGQTANGWVFQAVNTSGATRQVIGYAICATVAP
jgi:hypothetical protein